MTIDETVDGARAVSRAILAWVTAPSSRTASTTRRRLATRRAVCDPGAVGLATRAAASARAASDSASSGLSTVAGRGGRSRPVAGRSAGRAVGEDVIVSSLLECSWWPECSQRSGNEHEVRAKVGRKSSGAGKGPAGAGV